MDKEIIVEVADSPQSMEAIFGVGLGDDLGTPGVVFEVS